MADPYAIIFASELLGTFLLILLGCGINAGVSLKKNHAHGSGWIAITFGWGFAVLVGASVATASGGHLNPAVTIAQFATGMIPIGHTAMYLFAEFLGAFLGALVVYLLYKDQFKQTEDAATVGGVFFTGPAIDNKVRNLSAEIIATFVLVAAVFTTIMYTPFIMFGPLFVALVVVSIGLSLGGLTGYSINPARDLSPRLVHSIFKVPNKGTSNWNYSWIPAIGPIIGALLAASLLWLIQLAPGVTIPNLEIGASPILETILI